MPYQFSILWLQAEPHSILCLQGGFQDAFDAVQSGARAADEEVQAAWKHPIVRVVITVREGPPAQVTTSKLAALQASLSGKKPAAPPQQPPKTPLGGGGVKGRAAPAPPPPPPKSLRSVKSLPAQRAQQQQQQQPQTPSAAVGPGSGAELGPTAVALKLEPQETCEGEHSFAVRLSGFRDEAREACRQLEQLASAVMVRCPALFNPVELSRAVRHAVHGTQHAWKRKVSMCWHGS